MCSFQIICAFVVLSCKLHGTVSQQTGKVAEYCFTESFLPRCNTGEVIVMNHALYGRMHTGKCIHVDNNVGCFSDELQAFDRKCSGQRTCDFAVLNADLIGSLDCLQEMNPYLEAGYQCEKVFTPTRSRCTSSESIEIPQAGVNLASTVTMSTSCGSHTSPWILTAQPGQKLNVSITDFSWEKNIAENAPSMCMTYGYLVEAGRDDVFVMCGGEQRTRLIHVSQGHIVQMIFGDNLIDKRFIVHVDALGCPDIDKPPHATVERTGDSVTVECTTADIRSSLTCVQNIWLGELKSCPAAPTTTEAVAMPTTSPEKTGVGSKLPLVTQNHVIVFTIACVTVLACTIIIILGVYCTKRYGAKALTDNSYTNASLNGGNNSISKDTPVFYRPVYTNETVRHGSIDLLTHTPILGRRQASCPNILDASCDGSGGLVVNGPCVAGYPTVPRDDNNSVLYYIRENPMEEQHDQPEKIYQSLQPENRQLLG